MKTILLAANIVTAALHFYARSKQTDLTLEEAAALFWATVCLLLATLVSLPARVIARSGRIILGVRLLAVFPLATGVALGLASSDYLAAALLAASIPVTWWFLS